jgi:hypothetical protein
VYLVVVYLLFCTHIFNLFNGTFLGNICGVLLFTVLTAMLIVITINVVRGKTNTATEPSKSLTPIEQLKSYFNIWNTKYVKSVNIGPFMPWRSDITDVLTGILKKYENIISLLDDSFSKTDLTYITYIDTLNEVVGLSVSIAKSLFKRFDVFDYQGWCKDSNNERYTQYIAETREYLDKATEINLKMDNLVHELVRLDEISGDSLKELNELIDQTKQYKNI